MDAATWTILSAAAVTIVTTVAGVVITWIKSRSTESKMDVAVAKVEDVHKVASTAIGEVVAVKEVVTEVRQVADAVKANTDAEIGELVKLARELEYVKGRLAGRAEERANSRAERAPLTPDDRREKT